MPNALVKLLPLANRKRRWAQFSLGTLFISITVFCVWLAWRVELARRQREAINELHKLHVAVMYSDLGSRRGESRESAFASRLLGMAYREPVEYVGLHLAHELFHDPQRLEKALSLLPHLRGLKRLNLEAMPITDKELERVKPLTNLRKLNLSYTAVTDTGVAELRRALPHCEIVR
jgi:hypothetical protein